MVGSGDDDFVMKSMLLESIRTELRNRFGVMTRAAIEAHGAATDPGSRAESKYDTRSLEASYLASGQARAVEELAQSIQIFDALVLPSFACESQIEPGALVEVESDEGPNAYLLVPCAGGLEILFDGEMITLLSPSSRLYQELLGRSVGDFLSDGQKWVSMIS